MKVVCNISPAFLAAIGESFGNARQTVDSFNLFQLFTTAIDEVRKAENKVVKLSEGARCAVSNAQVWRQGGAADHPLPPPYPSADRRQPRVRKNVKEFKAVDKHQERILEH